MYYNSYSCYFCNKNVGCNRVTDISMYEICRTCIYNNKLLDKMQACRKYRLTNTMFNKLRVKTYSHYYHKYFSPEDFHNAISQLLTTKRRNKKKYLMVIKMYEHNNNHFIELTNERIQKESFNKTVLEYISLLLPKYISNNRTIQSCNNICQNIINLYKINHELTLMHNVLYLCETIKECEHFTQPQIKRKYELDCSLKSLNIKRSVNENAYNNYIINASISITNCIASFKAANQRTHVTNNNNTINNPNNNSPHNTPHNVVKPLNMNHERLLNAINVLEINVNVNDIVNTDQYKLYINNNLSLDQLINEYL